MKEACSRTLDTPENVPRLFDLVKAKDPKFLPAFYHAMRDTLVAKDIDQAARIAYGRERWRVVTLDGKLIDKAGTMTGGGQTQQSGLLLVQGKEAKVRAGGDSLSLLFSC